jgi:enterochelin esterase-like enzyme
MHIVKEGNMKNYLCHLLPLIVLILVACTPAVVTTAPVPTQVTDVPTVVPVVPTVTKQAYQSLSMIEIPAPSLANNVVGQSTERTIQVYLPPSYSTSDKRYPVLYYLPGYGDSTMFGIALPGGLDALMESGQISEMIIVIASGTTQLGGSFYVNSPVTGNWEDYIVKDVVGYMDEHFRTLSKPESRGITGHSMGGFGALNISMHRPDVFSAVYSLSPGLFDEMGLSESQMFRYETLINSFIEYEARLAGLSIEEAEEKMLPGPDQFTLAYGFAFAPNLDRHPPYFDYPFKDLEGEIVRDEIAWKKWEGGFGGIADEVLLYKENFLKLKGIAVDYGTRDEYTWIPKGSVYFGDQLSQAGIPVSVEGYDGSHQSELGERISEHMLPFFSRLLVFE